jgi:hypothetical protein
MLSYLRAVVNSGICTQRTVITIIMLSMEQGLYSRVPMHGLSGMNSMMGSRVIPFLFLSFSLSLRASKDDKQSLSCRDIVFLAKGTVSRDCILSENFDMRLINIKNFYIL